ncbi:MAG TPA: 50S ribosomal protein L24 [Acidimicrobiales bacterium]|jgi:large subunit ribosomal protein L24|nr:50S ribosomal protein L24 [Acidimicrobiales bacterium]
MKIHKGDDVLVLTGKFRGQRANVEEALPAVNKVILDNLNIAKRATKQSGSTMQAGIIDKLMPLNASNVAVWCPKHKGPAKIGAKIVDDKKVRACRKCGEVL